jgi:malate dehydrogenase (oxaloacetate-decarboxylating)(NADP+)
MYFSKYDRGHFSSMVHNWPHHDVHCIVVTDGSRVLGLGDLGVNGMGISIGKLALYVAAGGIAPHRVLPICLDVGTNNEKLRADPEYLGIREKRLEGEEYFDLVDEFMAAINFRWPTSLVQFEDFESTKAAPLLDRYRVKYRMFNDDIQGTGAVTLAGLMSAVKISGKALTDVRVLCVGAGAAGTGVCNQLLEGMMEAGMSRKDALAQFVLMTNLGVIGAPDNKLGNPNHKALNPMHVPWINPTISDGTALLDAIREFKPSVLLGLSTAAGIFDEQVIRTMAEINMRPIIMPMSNPTSRAE